MRVLAASGQSGPRLLSTDGTWDSLLTLTVPTPRSGAAAIYDPVRKRLILFGGGDRNDLWELPLSGTPIWHELHPGGTPPSGRSQHTLIYDPVRDRAVLFGGTNSAGNAVWVLTLSGTPSWKQLSTDGTPPSPRFGHTAVFDTIHEAMIVFGGLADGAFKNDTWALSLRSRPRWTPLDPAGPQPAPRSNHAAAYDARRHRMVMFGGGGRPPAFNDIWVLELAGPLVWHQLSADSLSPSPRAYHSIVYDSLRDQMLVFGGRTLLDTVGDTWALKLGTTRWDSIPGGPLRSWHAAIFDPVARRMIITTGYNEGGGPVNETWDLSLIAQPVWSQTVPPISPAPSPRRDYAAAYDPVRNRMVLFGGDSCGACFLVDTWTLSLTGPAIWNDVTEGTGQPAPRRGARMVYDPARERMVMFGGEGYAGCYDCAPVPYNDTWVLPLSGPQELKWQQLFPAGTPPPARYDHSAVDDPLRDRMLIYGGEAPWKLGDLWALTFADPPTWQFISTAGASPGARGEHEALYDPQRDRMVLVGGVDGDAWRNDVWSLSLTDTPSWTLLAPIGTAPAPRGDFPFVYDWRRDRALIFGGIQVDTHYNDTWGLALADPPGWSQLAPSNTPPGARAYLSGVYDSVSDRLVLFGGRTGCCLELGDAWTLAWDQVTDVASPPHLAPSFRLEAPAVASFGRGISLTLTTPSSGPCSLSLFDVAGRRVWVRDLGVVAGGITQLSAQLDRSLRAGLYILTARLDSLSASRKIYFVR